MFRSIAFLLSIVGGAGYAFANPAPAQCDDLPDYQTIKKALTAAQQVNNGGLGMNMWATVVDRSGSVCAVTFSGPSWDAQWLTARIVSAQKAYTANALSLDGLALATANLYTAVQPGNSLFGLQESQPIQADLAYEGPSERWGQINDPFIGKRIGGLNVFGGGLPLYSVDGQLLGAIGVSGDTSCADHAIAWRIRHALSLDYVPGGVGPSNTDQISYEGPWKHPHCQDPEKEKSVANNLPATRKNP